MPSRSGAAESVGTLLCRDSEVEDLDHGVAELTAVDEDVVWLEVAMHDAVLVRDAQGDSHVVD